VPKPKPPRSGFGAAPPPRPAPASPPPAIQADGHHADKTLRIAGLPAVAALFRREPERVLRLFYEDRMVPKVGDFCARLARLRRPYRLVDADELARVAGTVLHGGVVAVAEPRAVPAFDPEEARAWARSGQPLFVLDGIGNPHNLGAIARTLAFLGFRHLVLSDHPAQAGLSEAAYRVAEGGLEYLDIRRAERLPTALRRIAGDYRVIGTALGRGGTPLEALSGDPRPAALVLGNEEDGLPSATLDACEAVATLRGAGTVQSLNVSAAAAILAYALRPRPAAATEAPRRAGTKRPAPSGADREGRGDQAGKKKTHFEKRVVKRGGRRATFKDTD
jgi:TrmH RNA methyltransferase